LHVFPLSPGRLLVEFGAARLVVARVSRPWRWLRLSRCAPGPLARVVWLLQSRGEVVYEYVVGEPLDSIVVEALALGRGGEALGAAFDLGSVLARLHGLLARCPEGRFSLASLAEDRCGLAARAGLRRCPARAIRGGYTAYSHWDPHLGQTIRGPGGVVLVDLDGEPDASVPPPPEYDLAVAARSLDYASRLAQAPWAAPRLARALALGYCRLRRVNPLLFTVSYGARLAYEYYFEVSRRTGLEWVPESSIEAFEARRDPVHGAVLEVAEACARRY